MKIIILLVFIQVLTFLEPSFSADSFTSFNKTNKVNLILIANYLIDEKTVERFEIPQLHKERPGTWRIKRVQTEDDIINALRLEPNESIQTLFFHGLHNS